MTRKHENLLKAHSDLQSEHNDHKKKCTRQITRLERQNLDKENRLKDYSKKLSKFREDNTVADLDPFEMHRKCRLYQSKLEISEIHSLKLEEKLKEINEKLFYSATSKFCQTVAWVLIRSKHFWASQNIVYF